MSSIRVGVVMDPITGITPAKDSTLAMLLAAQGRGHDLHYFEQIDLCLWRGLTRLRADPSVTLVAAFFNILMALVVSSVFYNLQPTTGSFFQRGALLFFAVLLNAFASALEVGYP